LASNIRLTTMNITNRKPLDRPLRAALTIGLDVGALHRWNWIVHRNLIPWLYPLTRSGIPVRLHDRDVYSTNLATRVHSGNRNASVVQQLRPDIFLLPTEPF